MRIGVQRFLHDQSKHPRLLINLYRSGNHIFGIKYIIVVRLRLLPTRNFVYTEKRRLHDPIC